MRGRHFGIWSVRSKVATFYEVAVLWSFSRQQFEEPLALTVVLALQDLLILASLTLFDWLTLELLVGFPCRLALVEQLSTLTVGVLVL